MRYTNEPIDEMVDDIKGTASVLTRALLAGLNIVVAIVLGIILVTNLAAH